MLGHPVCSEGPSTMKSVHISGNDIEEIANTYRLNACNKTLIKTSEFILEQVWLALSKHHLIITIVNKVNILNMLSKILQ